MIFQDPNLIMKRPDNPVMIWDATKNCTTLHDWLVIIQFADYPV